MRLGDIDEDEIVLASEKIEEEMAKKYESEKRWCYALGSYYDAMGIAVRFVCDCIKRTQSMENPINYGVDFERGIPFYIKELGKV